MGSCGLRKTRTFLTQYRTEGIFLHQYEEKKDEYEEEEAEEEETKVNRFEVFHHLARNPADDKPLSHHRHVSYDRHMTFIIWNPSAYTNLFDFPTVILAPCVYVY